MPKFTAVMGKSKTNRIVSVEAATEAEAWDEINRQLKQNPQRRDIWRQWQTSGATMIKEPTSSSPPFDEAQANALIRGGLRELLAELSATGTVTVPSGVYVAYERAKLALKAFDQGVVA